MKTTLATGTKEWGDEVDEADSVHVVEQEKQEVEEDGVANENGAANEDVASLPDSA